VGRLIAKRLAFAVPTLLFVTFLVFALVNFAPGDAAVELAGENPTPERIQQIREDLRLDDPLLVRYGRWLGDAVTGDFGTSVTSRQEVSELITTRLAVTASLAAIALVLMIVLAIFFGILGALWPGRWIDRLITWVAALAIAAPPFWIGLVLVLLFAVDRSWFPAIGYTGLDGGVSEWLRHLILPAIALAALPAAELALQLKGALTEELGRDYLLAVRAKGMTARSIVGKHALKNAAIPVVTVLGHRIAQLLGGAVTIEAVFVLPGLGSLAVASTINRDIPVLLSIVVISTLFVIVVNLLVDISYGYFNPKVRT
jgi:peptide/nickel transport system permease protein